MTSRTALTGQWRLSAWPVLALGFRPFYLVAAIFAVLDMVVWLGWYRGALPQGPAMSGLTWHIHEMLFGFAPAVMAGFLLTAVRNWTGRPTPTGAGLAALVALWVAGRILMLTGPPLLAATVDLLFLPALGVAIARPIWQSRNVRNFKILFIIAALAGLNTVFHLAYLGAVAPVFLQVAYRTALDVIALLLAIMGDRVIPAFIANAIPAAEPRRIRLVEIAAVGSLVLVAAAELASGWWHASASMMFAVLAIAGVAHLIRLALWAPHRTVSNGLLLMLPVAYAWLPVALLLGALAHLGIGSPVAATHALTVGAMSGLMLAMMTRSALGHTGRALAAGPAEIIAFALLQLAALLRILAGMLTPSLYTDIVVVSGVLYASVFLIFVIAYWPKLTRPRVDGLPG